MNRDERRTLSKTMCHALRHAPHLYELELDEQGWTSLTALIDGLRAHRRAWRELDLPLVTQIVAEDSKGRYELDEQEGRIRALYGHSVEGRLSKKPATPPARLYHGTSSHVIDIIRRDGLKPMNRQFVHLSADQSTATEVGRRKGGDTLLLVVDAARAHADGITFYEGNALIWLSDAIPADYILP